MENRLAYGRFIYKMFFTEGCSWAAITKGRTVDGTPLRLECVCRKF